MIVFKGCSRCSGDLYVEKDLGTTDLVCLQCGFRRAVRSWIDETPPAGNEVRMRRELEEVTV